MMAHYAYLDENNVVVDVITGKEEGEDGVDWEAWYPKFRGLTCKRTSYNTSANAHSGEGTAFRGNYAGIGYTYDSTNDVFIAPKPYSKWVLDEDTWSWKAPTDMPDDGNEEDRKIFQKKIFRGLSIIKLG